ncbi:MAG: helicase SNF2 [Candidatus Cloacimonas sp. 4484_209]|nr:MAG: helicase SNF2 [Candidatus Cloacimonas sp. 4484_209]
MCSLFGFSNFAEFKKVFEDVKEGYDEDGRSYMYHRLISLENLDQGMRNKLADYDDNIRNYLQHINKKRDFEITLKYFQYIAVLFTEIYLDFYFRDPIDFLNKLTNFGHNREKYGDSIELITFTPRDMKNIAFWMATGSGKTIIMHINYLQFIRYNKGKHKIDYENFIIVTPNAGLTSQHMKESQLSSIPCKYFLDGEEHVSGDYPPIKVIEITKLTGEKKGEGVSIDIRSVTSKNIVFADEAHKGTSGDVWRSYREKLANDGFKFEYSATFGQALKKVDPGDELLQAYAKSILFDYSYKYFYSDGYGKDYRIINTKTLTEDLQYRFLLANALSFYEQLNVYESDENLRKNYNIERPLWVFIGSRVQPGKSREKEKTMSDILKVVKFLHKFLNDEEWAVNTIKKILEGKSGILDKNGNDIFARTYPETKFPYLRKSKSPNAREIYEDMQEKIFKTRINGALHLVDIKNAEGEIGLKVGPFGQYFGVINIGDEKGLLKYIRDNYKGEGIVVERDDTSQSLFEGLEKSKIDILVGARKFVEGWNSWRVSTMGLIHMGKTEGPLVIQLFGRGVRLKGYIKSLKRSSAVPDVVHPDYIPVLENLNIFGIQANYMEIFKDYLEKEGVPTEPVKEFEIPTKLHEILRSKKHDLQVPRIERGKTFITNRFIHLKRDDHISKITLDLRPRASILVSREEEAPQSQQKHESVHIEPQYLDLLNWDNIYREILDFKREKEWYNLLITKEGLMRILLPDENDEFLYELYLSDPSKIKPSEVEDLLYLEDLALRILKKYMIRYYTSLRLRWENKNLTYYELTRDDKNFFNKYVIKIKEKDLLRFQKLVDLLERKEYEPFYGEFDEVINNVYIDTHLYQPLLEDHDRITIFPKGLNPGEVDFINHLKKYLKTIQKKLEKENIFIYVLRNRTRGRGIGFFETHGFYPDFIVWIKKKNIQHILFVEPHGLVHVSEKDKEKIGLHEKIKELEKKLSVKTGKNVALDSYILSVTSSKVVKGIFNTTEDNLKDVHILFMEDNECIKNMLEPYIC